MNLNSVQLGCIQFEGKHSRADGKVYTVTNIPKSGYEKAKVDILFDLVRFKNVPTISYLDID